jgi:FAD:protein FMN transferase
MKIPHWPRRMVVAIILAQLVLAALIIQMVVIRPGRATGGFKRIERTEFAMDTVVEATVFATRKKQGEQAIAAVFDEISRLEAILARTKAGSDLERINSAAGKQPVTVSAPTFEVIQLGLDVGGRTDGAFDITIAPLIELWGFGTGETRVPTTEQLAHALNLVDFRNVSTYAEERQVYLQEADMRLDLGGIAKGFIVDKAVERLRAEGIISASVDAGGDIRVIGNKMDGTPWRIGIRDPRDRRRLVAVIPLTNRAIVTSGDYERLFFHEGERYHHILNPGTGMPARGVISVTIVANDAFTADALSTAVFVMGLEQGMAFVEKLPDIEAVIITEDEQIHLSSGLEGKVELL